MIPAQIHLSVSHLALFSIVLGSVVLIYGVFNKRANAKIGAYLVLITASAVGSIALILNQSAIDTIELIPGVTADRVYLYGDSTKLSLTALIFLGISSINGLIFTFKNPSMTKTLALVTLSISLVCFGMTSWVGYLEGQLKHSEIDPVYSMIPQKLISNNTIEY